MQEFTVLVWNDTELDANGGQFESYPYSQLRLHAGGALVVWPGMLFPNSRGIKAEVNLRLCNSPAWKMQ